MSELYLILHKVRGQPAFDIAQPLQIGDEEGWIIPTSGHRAYPYWSSDLYDLGENFLADPNNPPMPDDWPDHYNTFATQEPTVIRTTARELLAKLGLGSSPKLKRRPLK